jgi:hypothetical protein
MEGLCPSQQVTQGLLERAPYQMAVLFRSVLAMLSWPCRLAEVMLLSMVEAPHPTPVVTSDFVQGLLQLELLVTSKCSLPIPD